MTRKVDLDIIIFVKLEARISTQLGGLRGKAKKITTASVEKISKIKSSTLGTIDTIKGYDYKESIVGVGKSVSKARRKTISFYRRPINDISHLSILLVILLTLFSGLSAFVGTDNVVKIDPFAKNDKTNLYLSATEKRILEADSVATIASVYDPGSLSEDANAVTAEIYKRANIATAGDKYINSIPLVSISSDNQTNNSPIQYVIQDGDTLSGIATKFNITTDTLRYANQIEDIDNLKPGQTLTILPATGVLHTVTQGQTLIAIANRYGVSEAMITEANNLYGDEIQPGMKLMIPDAEIPDAPKPAPTPQTRVAGGTSSSGISYVPSSSGPNHFPYGWCTWWVASKRNVPWSGNAWQWYGNAQAYGRPVGKTPVPGAIVVTWESGYGHVGYVESASGNSFTISEMNYTGFGRVSTRTVTTSSIPLIGFIY